MWELRKMSELWDKTSQLPFFIVLFQLPYLSWFYKTSNIAQQPLQGKITAWCGMTWGFGVNYCFRVKLPQNQEKLGEPRNIILYFDVCTLNVSALISKPAWSDQGKGDDLCIDSLLYHNLKVCSVWHLYVIVCLCYTFVYWEVCFESSYLISCTVNTMYVSVQFYCFNCSVCVHSEGRSMFIFLSVLSFFIEGSYDSVVHTFSFSSVCISVKLCLYKVLFFLSFL